MIAMWLWLGCKAASLGIDLPAGGRDAITMEDLNRDTWVRTSAGPDRAPGAPAAAEATGRLQRRLAEVHTLPAFGDDYVAGGVVCGRRDGRSDKAALILAFDDGRGASGAVSAAAVVSLAKALDGAAPPAHTQVFCVLPAQGGAEALAAKPPWPLDQVVSTWLLGPFGGGELVEAPAEPVAGLRATRLGTAPPAWAGTDTDEMGRYDYRALTEQVRQIYDRVLAAP